MFSHNYKGLIYCNKCGAYGIEHFCNIANECPGHTQAGARLRKKIENGILPTQISRVLDSSEHFIRMRTVHFDGSEIN